MDCRLPAETLNEIVGYLEDDKLTLHSCLLTNRLLCKISVVTLWKNIWEFKVHYESLKTAKSILGTLVSCLPIESKELLRKKKIFIQTPTTRNPLFNYAGFFKVLSIYGIYEIVDKALRNKSSTNSSFEEINCLVIREIVKMLMNQTSSLKKLVNGFNSSIQKYDKPFICSFEAKNLEELCCNSTLSSEFFCQLSQTCHNLQFISMRFCDDESLDGLVQLISLQNNLKKLKFIAKHENWIKLIPTLTKHSNTITKLYIGTDDDELSFISQFSNLEELVLSFSSSGEGFKKLQDADFSKLKVLKFPDKPPRPEYVMKFLENNGKNLQQFFSYESDIALHSSIAKFCPNLRSLFVIFGYGEVEILKNILINCQCLENVRIWYESIYLTEKDVFETAAKYLTLNNFCELKLYNSSCLNTDIVSPKNLELFYKKWISRKPKHLLKLVLIKDYNVLNEKTIKVIGDYKKINHIFKIKIKRVEEELAEEWTQI